MQKYPFSNMHQVLLHRPKYLWRGPVIPRSLCHAYTSQSHIGRASSHFCLSVVMRQTVLGDIHHDRRPSAHGKFLRRGVRGGYRRSDELTAAQLVEDSDDQLLRRVQYVSGHVLTQSISIRYIDAIYRSITTLLRLLATLMV